MVPILNVEGVRYLEAAAAADGLTYAEMMERAGRALATRAAAYTSDIPEAPRITVLVGPGNNGGDGLVAARVLAQEGGIRVRCYLLKARSVDDPLFLSAREAGVRMAVADDDADGRVLRNMVASAHVVIDALFGIGVKLPLRNEAARILRRVNAALLDISRPAKADERLILPDIVGPYLRQRPVVIAADCPSGLDCDSGALDADALRADETVTFITAKPGLLQFPGAESVGRLSVATLGIPIERLARNSDLKLSHILVDADQVRDLLPFRSSNSNKGTFGKALIVAGSERYIGAVGLASLAAYRVGVGLVTAAVPATIVSGLSAMLVEPTWLPLTGSGQERAAFTREMMVGYDALLVGPGLGTSVEAQELVRGLLETGKESLPPLVLDADALNILSKENNWSQHIPTHSILTPHPGEMGRLCGMSIESVQSDRCGLAARVAREWGFVIVLKGAHTVVAAPDGRLAVLPFKTDALATAGTGDVLAGLIVGLRAQGSSAFEAAVSSAYLHGVAGELASQHIGSTRAVVASDVRDHIGAALARFEFSR